MKKVLHIIKRLIGYLFLIPIYIYKYAISPFTPASCRHTPTCSEYFIEAVKVHGPIRGSILGFNRLSRCHPWGTHGYDPVPTIHFKKFKPSRKRPKSNRLKRL